MHGGRDADGAVMADCWLLQSDGHSVASWSEVESKPSVALYDHSLSSNERVMYIFGGLDSDGAPCADLRKLDCSDPTLIQTSIVECLNLCPPRHGHAAALCNQNLIVLGGVGPSVKLDIACILDLGTRVWSKLHLSAPSSTLPFWVNHALHWDGSDVLTVVGGGANCFAFGPLFSRTVVRLRLCYQE